MLRQQPDFCWVRSGSGEEGFLNTAYLGRGMELADGTPAAVGVRVVAVGASGRGHYQPGHVGVICKVNPGDPVVRWDHSDTAHQSSRGKMNSVQ